MNDLKGIIEDCNKSDLVSDKIIKKIIEIIGQEEWQDLHDENNDICTTMGELIITLKGIADLEKENAELKEQVKEWKALQELYDGKAFKWQGKYGEVNEQLTKAKEFLKEFVQHYKAKTIYVENMQDLLEQSEQFLNSEVEK